MVQKLRTRGGRSSFQLVQKCFIFFGEYMGDLFGSGVVTSSCHEGVGFSGPFPNCMDRLNLTHETKEAWDELTGLESSLVDFSLFGF